MAVLTGSKVADRTVLDLPFDARRSTAHWISVARTAVLLGGLVLTAVGISLGLAVVWTQLARALPLANLVHHPRLARATMLVGAGLASMLLGRRRSPTNLPGIARVAVAVLLVAAGAPPALAVDATGRWSGTWSCRQKAGTLVAGTRRGDSTMLITQNEQTVFIELDGTAYDGLSHDSERNPRRARGSAMRSIDDGEALTFTIRVNDVRGTAKIRGESTFPNDPGGSHCSYRFSRTSLDDPHVAPPSEANGPCGDGILNHATSEECDRTCEPLDVSGHWEGTWGSDVTGDRGEVVADLSQDGDLVFGMISFPPFDDQISAPPFLRMGSCAPAAFTTGAMLASGIGATLDGIATNASLAGRWAMSDGSDYGAWLLSR